MYLHTHRKDQSRQAWWLLAFNPRTEEAESGGSLGMKLVWSDRAFQTTDSVSRKASV